MSPNKSPAQFERLTVPATASFDPTDVTTEHRIALVHILTPEFQGIDPASFADIGAEIVAKASPEELYKALLDMETDGRSVISYQPPELGWQWIRMSVTPREFELFSRHIPMLAKTAYNRVLNSRDQKLQKETGDPYATARKDEDIEAAQRSGVRVVRARQYKMAEYLKSDIEPRIELVEKFVEMTKNPNLVRGNRETVRNRFETLRIAVFGDMLDAIGNQKQWTAAQAERAIRILQKRLYLEPDPIKRRENFVSMLGLAKEYYASKRALVLGRIAESQKYFQDNPAAVWDVATKDAERNGVE